MKKGILLLEDGSFYNGETFGYHGESFGEVVFNTSITGYQEILTDPSYNGQIVLMTYPQIGNYGINSIDIESRKPFVRGFIVRELSKTVSNWRAENDLSSYLSKNKIIGIEIKDTREITKKIRKSGVQRGMISSLTDNPESLWKRVNEYPSISEIDLVAEVSCEKPYFWNEGSDNRIETQSDKRFSVVAMDFGIKFNMLRKLYDLNCNIKVVPSNTSAEEILSMNPDGILLSNGPGDPVTVRYASENVKKLIGEKPIFGICLGHQILSLALGGKTYKLKFGHRGANQPVKDLATGKVEITSQNHGFAVDPDSLPKDVEVTHINLNDNTVEGIKHKDISAFSVQYHPEASPGPQDSSYLFNKFICEMEKFNC